MQEKIKTFKEILKEANKSLSLLGKYCPGCIKLIKEESRSYSAPSDFKLLE